MGSLCAKRTSNEYSVLHNSRQQPEAQSKPKVEERTSVNNSQGVSSDRSNLFEPPIVASRHNVATTGMKTSPPMPQPVPEREHRVGEPKRPDTSPKVRWTEKTVDGKKKPCLDELQEEVEHALKTCTVEKLRQINSREVRGCSVMLDKFDVTGEAYISKQGCHFSVTVSFTWEALDSYGGGLGVTGRCEVADFTQSTVTPKVLIRKARSGNSLQAEAMIEWMKNVGVAKIAEYLNGPDLSEAVVQELGVVSDVDEAAVPSQSIVQPAVRNLAWAERWFSQRLSTLVVTMFGGLASAKITLQALTGDISDAPRVIFRLRITCEWLVTMNSGPGTAEGLVIIPDFTSENDISSIDIFVEKAEGKKSSGQLVTGFKQVGVSAVRDILGHFLSEVRTT